MRIGYYQAFNGTPAQPNQLWSEVKNRVNLYVVDWLDGQKLPPLVGTKIWACLDMEGAPQMKPEDVMRTVIRWLKPQWSKVIALSIGDEPKWSQAEINRRAKLAKDICRSEGLIPVPVGAVFSGTKPLKWNAKELDWVGIEGYLDYQPGESSAAVVARLKKDLAAKLAKIAPEKKLIVVCQSYDRNGTWKNIDSLIGLQEPTFSFAKAQGKRLLALLLFAWGYKGGTKSIPSLAAEHTKLLKRFL